jgi:hypothetical protein
MLGICLYSCPYLNYQKCYVFVIIIYFFSSKEAEKSAERFCLEGTGEGEREWGWVKEGEMTQTM